MICLHKPASAQHTHVGAAKGEENDIRGIKLLHEIQHLLEVRKPERVLPPLGERARGLDDVLDLPAVHLLFAERAQLVARDAPVRKAAPVDALEERDPDLALRVRRQVRVPERDVDARLERLVEYPDPVRGEEEDPAEVPSHTHTGVGG